MKNTPLVMPIEGIPSCRWFLEDHVLQTTIKRFVGDENFRLLLPASHTGRLIARRLLHEIPSLKDRIFLTANGPWSALLRLAERTNTDRVMVLPENACGMPAAAIDLVEKILKDNEYDLLHSDQIAGLAPWVLSTKYLQQIVNGASTTPERLNRFSLPGAMLPGWGASLLWKKLRRERTASNDWSSQRLPEISKNGCRFYNLRFLKDCIAPEPIYYLPRLDRDRALAHYLVEKTPLLDNILRSVTDLPAPESSGLAAHFREFCETFAITYPMYWLTGDPEIPENIRSLTSNPKGMGDCYLRAIHFTKFLRSHGGLHAKSRVLDIGCGWGVLALGLVNVIEEPGSYLGLDVQKKAIAWAQKNIAPLNDRLSFVQLDIANTMYNPKGAIQLDQVQLPIEDDSVDLIVLSSVFTHMRREGIESYLREFRRILDKGGILAFSYFHSSFFGLNEDYKVRFPDNPDRMTLFSTGEIKRILAESGLVPARPQVNYSGRFNSKKPFFQTFMFATKAP